MARIWSPKGSLLNNILIYKIKAWQVGERSQIRELE